MAQKAVATAIPQSNREEQIALVAKNAKFTFHLHRIEDRALIRVFTTKIKKDKVILRPHATIPFPNIDLAYCVLSMLTAHRFEIHSDKIIYRFPRLPHERKKKKAEVKNELAAGSD